MLKSLNDITNDDLKEISRLAELFFTPKEIAVMLEINTGDLLEGLSDEKSDVYRSFFSGRLQSEVELRRSVIKLAKSGSSPAQTMALDLLQKSKVKMLER